MYEQIRERDADFYARLEAAGFQHDWGEDGSGLFMKYLRRASGYYIDVGASELVASGKIKLQPGQVDHLTEDAVVMADGTELPADLVVYATGYESMNGFVADLISQEVADKVGKVWGLGSDTAKDPGPWEGEQRNMWKPTQQEGAVVPRRQPAPVAPLLAVPRAPAQGARRGHRHARVRATGGPSHAVAPDQLDCRGELLGGERAPGQRGALGVLREDRVADVLDAHAGDLVRDRAGRGRVPVETERA